MIDTVTDCLDRKKEDVDVIFPIHSFHILKGLFHLRQKFPVNQGLS